MHRKAGTPVMNGKAGPTRSKEGGPDNILTFGGSQDEATK